MALEEHIQDLEERFRKLQNAYIKANPAPARPPEGDDADAANASGHNVVGFSTFPDED